MIYGQINTEQLFRNAMSSNGIITDAAIIPDGNLHRFHVNGDKNNSRNGWYILYLDDLPSGAFGSWKSGISSKWSLKSRIEMTTDEWIKYSLKMTDARNKRNKAKVVEQQQAAKRALRIWNLSTPADIHHPYLSKKQILPFSARQHRNLLVLPLIDFDHKIWSIQFIHPDGSKRFLLSGAKKGNFILVNNTFNASMVLICEGYATGATLAQAYANACVIAAIDAGNLECVAIAARNRWPGAKIIICADDDRQTLGNPGTTNGRRAAIAAGAFFTSPNWPIGIPGSLSDFNDLACWSASTEVTV
jgi:putative DNA primase/helicase